MVTADPINSINPINMPEMELLVGRWSLAKRVGFRFCFVFFGLYCLTTQIFGGMLSIPNVDIPDLATLPPVRPLIFWTAVHFFGYKQQIVYNGSGSGDKVFDWVMAFCYVMIALLATIVWSILDRRRTNYHGAYKWFRVFLRFSLGSQMLIYGFVKLFPMQMPFPSLSRLVEPYGNFSPMGSLWYFIGASPAYEMLCGSAEVLGGLLVLIPRTTMLGALVCAGVTSQIFILNMTYDVPVKQLSLVLLLMSLFLAAPEFARLRDFFLRDRAVGPSTQPELFRTARANRIALVVQLVFLVWLVGTDVYGDWGDWHKYGGGAPKSALYGIWKVDRFMVDGQERSPLLGDYGRWRRVIFDYPEYMSYERMDDSTGGYEASIDEKGKTIALTKSNDKKWKGSLHYLRTKQAGASPEQLVLDGIVGGQPMRMELELVDRSKFTLVGRGFHWVQDYPFNR